MNIRHLVTFAIVATGLVPLSGCHTDMWIQPRASALQESDFFPDGQASRPLVANTVARGNLREDDAYYTGVVKDKLVKEMPFPVTKEVLLRGQERFNIFCSPCHGQLGDGKGMIAQRGLSLRKKPASYHTKRLREIPIGHFYDVITNGSGVMYSYAARVEPDDRWRIAAYVRALQLSQNATASDVPPEILQQLSQPGQETVPEPGHEPKVEGAEGGAGHSERGQR
jgi:cytochrome c553